MRDLTNLSKNCNFGKFAINNMKNEIVRVVFQELFIYPGVGCFLQKIKLNNILFKIKTSLSHFIYKLSL